MSIYNYRPSLAGLKKEGQRDATASTPMELPCLAWVAEFKTNL